MRSRLASHARRGSENFDPWRKQIAASTYRLDDRGILRVSFDLAPDTAHQHVDTSSQAASVAALRQVNQAFARQDASGSFAECLQKVELGPGHGDARSVGASYFAQTEVELPAEKRKDVRIPGRTGAVIESLSSQDGAYPCQQFTRIKWLR